MYMEYSEKRQEILEEIQRLCLMDDILMSTVFDNDIANSQHLVRTILGRNDISVISSKSQSTITNPYGRSVRLDILIEDSEHKMYDVEVQRLSVGASPQRARLNASLLDTRSISAGQEYDDIKDSFVIFITGTDYYDKGSPTYQIERKTPEGESFGDGSHIIYVNGTYRGDDDLGTLMHDFHCTAIEDMHNVALKEKVRYVKTDDKEVEQMYQSMKSWGEKNFAEGKAEGRAEGISIAISNLMAKLSISYDEACEMLMVSPEEKAALAIQAK